jgi:hypothetical protein
MGLFPETKSGKIEFFQSKIAPWGTSATQIGTTSGAVTALDALVTAAADALAAQVAAEAAKQAATLAADNAIAAMVVAGMDIVAAIRAKARTAGVTVYELAQIPPPATPTPVGAPGTPYMPKVTLNPVGTLVLKWKCSNPTNCNNVQYHVYRKATEVGSYDYLGTTGDKKFLDTTIPAGATQLFYQVQGSRKTSVGVAAEFIVKFGTGGGSGATVASLATPTGNPGKIAA